MYYFRIDYLFFNFLHTPHKRHSKEAADSKSNSSSAFYFISICALFSNSLFIFSDKLSSSTLYSI